MMISTPFASWNARGAARGWIRSHGEAAIPRLAAMIGDAMRAGDHWTAARLDRVLQQVEQMLDAAYDAQLSMLEAGRCRTS